MMDVVLFALTRKPPGSCLANWNRFGRAAAVDSWPKPRASVCGDCFLQLCGRVRISVPPAPLTCLVAGPGWSHH